MKITQMIMDKKNTNKIHIYVDGEYFVDLDAEVVFSLGLKKEEELDIVTLDKMQEKQKSVQCYNKSLALLSKNLKTQKQLKDYLYQKGFTTPVIEECILRLEKIGFIDDDRYAKMFIESKKSYKGKNAIVSTLISKGIPREIIDNNMKDFTSSSDVIKSLEKKYMKNKTYDAKNIVKLKRYLLSKGFMYEEINRVIGDYNEDRD